MFKEDSTKSSVSVFLVVALGLVVGGAATADDFNQRANHQVDRLGYYHILTTGEPSTPPAGGYFRYITDDPDWEIPIDEWQAKPWFPQNTGLAMTLWREGEIVWQNHAVETQQTGEFFQAAADASGQLSKFTPGLTSFFSMSNNYDMIYAAYFKITEPVTFDQISGYFAPVAGFSANWPRVDYRMNIWSVVPDENGIPMPAEKSFTGDIFATDEMKGDFEYKYTELRRVWTRLDEEASLIYRLTFTPDRDEPITLPPGEYFFSHDAVLRDPFGALWISPVAATSPFLLLAGGGPGGPGFGWGFWPLAAAAPRGHIPPGKIIPEPATALLLGTGIATCSGVAWLRRRRRK